MKTLIAPEYETDKFTHEKTLISGDYDIDEKTRQIMLSEEEKGADLQPLSEISEPVKIESAKKSAKDEKMVSTAEKINPEQESLNQVLAAKTMTEMKQVFASLKEQDRISYAVFCLKKKTPRNSSMTHPSPAR